MSVHSYPADIQTVDMPLSAIKPGDKYPGGSINSRRYSRDEITEKKNSIREFGVLQSLLVIPDPAHTDPGVARDWYCAAGNLRLAALFELRKEKVAPFADEAYRVPVVMRPDFDSAMALAASLAENTERLPLHPVNVYEIINELVSKRKMSVEDVARRYFQSERQIRAALALGGMGPAVRKAWLDGEIDANVAKEFPLAGDAAEQDALFKKLKRGHNLWHGSVRQAAHAGDRNSDAYLRYVGKEAYLAAGGVLIEDLFSEEGKERPTIKTPKVLEKLAREKLDAAREELVKDGWSFAVIVDQSHDALYSWDRLVANKKDATKEIMAKSGCLVQLLDNGSLDIRYGFVKPGSAGAKEAAAKKRKTKSAERHAKEKKGAGDDRDTQAVSNALAQRLSTEMTLAAADVLSITPQVALAAAIAGIQSESHIVCMSEKGLRRRHPNSAAQHDQSEDETDRYEDPPEFLPIFKVLVKKTPAELTKALAIIVARSLNFFTLSGKVDDPDVAAICDALDAKKLHAALMSQFAAKDYFDSASKAACLAAVSESLGADACRPIAGKPKADVVAFCVANVPKTGWLPPEIRPPHYLGPAVRQPAVKAKKEPVKTGRAKKKTKARK